MLYRYVHPADIQAYLDAGWAAVGICRRFKVQIMTAPVGTAEPASTRVLSEGTE
jgi:hypothetical protein